jgi:hypothetical protein
MIKFSQWLLLENATTLDATFNFEMPKKMSSKEENQAKVSHLAKNSTPSL